MSELRHKTPVAPIMTAVAALTVLAGSLQVHHGTADTTVPMFFTDRFAASLVEGGHDVVVITPDGVDHHAVYAAEVAAPLILSWLGT